MNRLHRTKDCLIDFLSKHPGKVSTPTVAFSVTFILGVSSFAWAVWMNTKLFDTTTYATCLGVMLGGAGGPYIANLIKGVTSAE